MTLSLKPKVGSGGPPAVGLDIGASAVRGVQLGSRRKVVACGQVGLHPGTVVDGEVRDGTALADALRRLWAEAGFTSTKVVVAVGGQRVIVREAEVTAMSADDFRTAINFEVQDLIPIAATEALLDFSILGPAAPTTAGRERMRILLSAADRLGVGKLLDVLASAGLEAAAIDVAPAALLRAAGSQLGDGTGLVSVGAQLTNVMLATEEAFFNRTMAIGAEQLTKGIGVRLGVDFAEAESVKRYAGSDQRGATRAAALLADEAQPLVEQIVESFEFFHSQGRTEPLTSVLLSGGGGLSAGLSDALARSIGAEVRWLDPFADLDITSVALEAADLARFRASAAVATGLALWTPTERSFNLMPEEVLAARARRKAIVTGGAALAVVATVLAGVGVARHHQVDQVKGQVAAVTASNTALTRSINALGGVTSYNAAVADRQKALTAAGAGLDLPATIGMIEAAVPASQYSLTSVAVAPPAATPSAPTAATGAAAGSTITMSVVGKGGTDTVAQWLRLLHNEPELANISVPGDSVSPDGTHFTCTATIVTAKAPAMTYPWEAKK